MYLCINQNAIHILEKNMDKVDWTLLSRNPNAIHILERNIDRVDWKNLSSNRNAIEILKNNWTKIDWINIFLNRSIFELDLFFLKKRMDIIREELMMKVFHPQRFSKYLDIGYDICNDEYV
jgi:hypothetical protein